MKIAIVGFGHVGLGANACLAAIDRKVAVSNYPWAALLPTQRRPLFCGYSHTESLTHARLRRRPDGRGGTAAAAHATGSLMMCSSAVETTARLWRYSSRRGSGLRC
jgi:hypothetical protein